jgi:hypothetical protein
MAPKACEPDREFGEDEILVYVSENPFIYCRIILKQYGSNVAKFSESAKQLPLF